MEFYNNPPIVDPPKYASAVPIFLQTESKPVFQMTKNYWLALATITKDREGRPLKTPIMYIIICPYPLHQIIMDPLPTINVKPESSIGSVAAFHFLEAHDNLFLIARIKPRSSGQLTLYLEFRNLRQERRDVIELNELAQWNAPVNQRAVRITGNMQFAAVLAHHPRRDCPAFLSIISLRDRRLLTGFSTSPRRLSSLTFLGGNDPCFLTSNPEGFCLDMWIIRQDSKLVKTATLELPPLAHGTACMLLDCRPLDSADPDIYKSDPSIIVDCVLSYRESPSAKFSILIKLKYLNEVYRHTVSSYGPRAYAWAEWGVQRAWIYDTAYEIPKNLNSGHTFTTQTAPIPEPPLAPPRTIITPDGHTVTVTDWKPPPPGVVVSLWDLRKLLVPVPTLLRLVSSVPTNNLFRGHVYATHVEHPPTYRVRLTSKAYPISYEGLVGEIDNGIIIHLLKNLLMLFAQSIRGLRWLESRSAAPAAYKVYLCMLTQKSPSSVRMYSIAKDARIFDHQTKDLFELDFGIALHAHAQASLLAGRHSPQDKDATTSFASPSDEDVESLKFLARYCSSSLNDLGEDFEISERIMSSPDSPIQIATPVPLPYSARSNEVLESMISGPKGAWSSHVFDGGPEKSCDALLTQLQDEDTSRKHDSTRPAAENQPVLSQAVSRTIRSVSPSTLIALTEPYLMAWSTRLPLSPLPAQLLRSTGTTREGARIIPAPAMHSGRNSWGY
ncbi:hypothetical protein C0989_005435 [Termitomyces sp. Mn162]|nr:hypothetical protein C0989_005435 [Termitomyces sp. Mn162]